MSEFYNCSWLFCSYLLKALTLRPSIACRPILIMSSVSTADQCILYQCITNKSVIALLDWFVVIDYEIQSSVHSSGYLILAFYVGFFVKPTFCRRNTKWLIRLFWFSVNIRNKKSKINNKNAHKIRTMI